MPRRQQPRLMRHFLPGGIRGWRTLHMIKEFLDDDVPPMKKGTVGSRIAAMQATPEWFIPLDQREETEETDVR